MSTSARTHLGILVVSFLGGVIGGGLGALAAQQIHGRTPAQDLRGEQSLHASAQGVSALYDLVDAESSEPLELKRQEHELTKAHMLWPIEDVVRAYGRPYALSDALGKAGLLYYEEDRKWGVLFTVLGDHVGEVRFALPAFGG